MYRRLLVTLDGSEMSEEALPYAEDLAEKMSSQVDLLRVAPRPQPLIEEGGRVVVTIDQEMERMTTDFNQYLTRIAFRFRAKGLTVRSDIRFGDPAEEIVDYAKENNISMIVMCTHGRSGISRWVYGSVAERVLRAAPTPVLLVRASGAGHD